MKYLSTLTVQQQNDLINIATEYQERSFRYDLLDRFENFKKTLGNVVDGSGRIDVNNFGNLKRSGTFVLSGEDSDVDFINDRIKVYCTLSDGVVSAEYPLGVYLLSSPTKRRVSLEYNEYTVNFYSKLQILLEDKLNETLVINENASYINEIKELVISSGLDATYIENSSATFSRPRIFFVGESKLSVINTLLNEINFEGLYTDNDGNVRSQPKIKDKLRESEFDYEYDEKSIIQDGSSEMVDYFNLPNAFTLVATNPDNQPLISTFKNYNTSDPTSIPSRGREIDYYEEVSDVTDQATLNERLDFVIERETQVYGMLTFATSINPLHVYNECYNVDVVKYIEESYSIQLSTNGTMTHTARRVSNA